MRLRSPQQPCFQIQAPEVSLARRRHRVCNVEYASRRVYGMVSVTKVFDATCLFSGSWPNTALRYRCIRHVAGNADVARAVSRLLAGGQGLRGGALAVDQQSPCAVCAFLDSWLAHDMLRHTSSGSAVRMPLCGAVALVHLIGQRFARKALVFTGMCGAGVHNATPLRYVP